ncbi:MAG: ribosomal protein S18 acetylase RimI-like enzyme [Roseivirga sp.]|jgi:ribosomal protein S18 acetylase RimI-like enzyme
MQILKTASLSIEYKNTIMRIWNEEYPVGLVYEDLAAFEVYLSKIGQAMHYLIVEENQLKGWMATFDREDERWFSIIISPNCQQQGLGRMLLNEAKKEHIPLNGWVADHDNDLKINGLAYLSPLGFYSKNKFVVMKETRLELKNLSAIKIKWQP